MILNSIKNWFTGKRHPSSPRRRSTVRLRVEGLEGRVMPAVLSLAPPPLAPAFVAPAVVAAAPSLGDRMGDFLNSKLGKRVGGGECAHIATEALRVAGADFTRTEASGTQDYVWTTNRIARLTQGSQLAGKVFKVGDILQYNNATLRSGGTSKLLHHTQVVAAVDSRGRITKVYEQNVNGNRTVQKHDMLDLSKLNGGSVSIYRAVARANPAGLREFTIVNNTSSSKTYTLQIGSSNFSSTLTAANTANSYSTRTATFSGNATVKLKIGNSSITVEQGAAYELFTMSNGSTGIRRI